MRTNRQNLHKHYDSCAPVVLFAYNRPEHTAKVLDNLTKCKLSELTPLVVYLDGPKSSDDKVKQAEILEYLSQLKGFHSLDINHREDNNGLANNIINGVNDVIDTYGRVIVLEDDILVSPSFLEYMNKALNLYKNDKSVWHISGWNYPIQPDGLKDMFFWRVMNCWGWATWSDRWQHFEKNPSKLIEDFTSEQIHRFNLDSCCNFWGQIEDNRLGKLNTWAIFWYATIFKNNGLCLNPTQTLVDNIGFGSGTHCHADKTYKDILSFNSPIDWSNEIVESDRHLNKVRQFLFSQNPVLPLELPHYNLSQDETSQLINLLVQQDFSLKNSLEQMYYLLDSIWEQYELNNLKLDNNKLQDYYSHPVWVLKDLYAESDPVSVSHRESLAMWMRTERNINKIINIGRGMGVLARVISTYNTNLHIEILEPFPSNYTKRKAKEFKNIEFVSELKGTYDCITLMDVLEHLEDPIGTLHSLLPNIKDDGYLIAENFFKPVKKCNLPCTFHLHYSFSEIMKCLGFDFIDAVPNTHIQIFKKVHLPNFNEAREKEKLSRKIYENVKNDAVLLAESSNAMLLNINLSKLYNKLDEVTSPSDNYIVYGAGTGARLLVEALNEQVEFLVDKNPNTWSETRFGKKIHAPEILQETTAKIIISVFGREDVISEYLLSTLKIPSDRILEITL